MGCKLVDFYDFGHQMIIEVVSFIFCCPCLLLAVVVRQTVGKLYLSFHSFTLGIYLVSPLDRTNVPWELLSFPD